MSIVPPASIRGSMKTIRVDEGGVQKEFSIFSSNIYYKEQVLNWVLSIMGFCLQSLDRGGKHK